MPNFIPAIQLQGLEALLQGRPSFPKQKVFWSNLPSPLTSCCMGGPAYLYWFATQKPNLSTLWLPYENQIAGLEIIVLESFNTLNLQSPVERVR